MRCFLQLCFWSLLFIIRFRLFRPLWMSGATTWAIWYVAAVTSVPPSLPCPCVKLPPSARAGRVSVGKPLWCGAAATAADASVTAIGVDAGGAAKCAQRARVAHEGRDFKIKATRTPADAWIFLWKESRKRRIGPLCASMAGMQVERLCQDRSHLSWRSKGGEKKNILRPRSVQRSGS